MTTTSTADDLASKIKTQVEFYFSDSNFPKDKHLQIQAKLNPEGYIPISHLLTFKRMQQLTTDIDAVVGAIKDSLVVTVSPDNKSVKRANPIPEEDTSLPRTVYTKGWKEGATIEKLKEFYTPFGEVNAVRLRRKKTGEFKGSAVIEFAAEETAKKVLTEKPKYEDLSLVYQPGAEWVQEKREQAQAHLKHKKEKAAQEKEEKNAAKKEKETEELTKDLAKGTVVKFVGVGGGLTREALQPIFGSYGIIKFTDFQKGETEGYIRYATPEEAKTAVERITTGKLEIAGCVPTVTVLEGEAEEEYRRRYAEHASAKASKRGGKGGRGGRGAKGGRGGRGGGRGGKGKRKGGDDDGEGSNKKAKVDGDE